MLFERYTDSQYEDAKAALPQLDSNEVFLDALGIRVAWHEVEPYLEDYERAVPKNVMILIFKYLKRWAKVWQVELLFEDPAPFEEIVCSHLLVLCNYLDAWHMAIQEKSSQTTFIYPTSLAAQRFLLRKFKGATTISLVNQEPISVEGDSIATIKLMATVFKRQDLKISVKEEEIREWKGWSRLVDLFLITLHQKQNELNLSKPSEKTSSFKPEPEFSLSSLSESRFQKSLNRSALKHRFKDLKPVQPEEEMVSLSKPEFMYMMEKFKRDVVDELRKRGDEDPNAFLQQHLQSYGELKSKNKGGEVGYYVKISRDNLQELLLKYEQYYVTQLQQQKQEEARIKAQQQYEYFLQFQQLLNYYYQTDQGKYADLVAEYNKKLNDQIIEKIKVKPHQVSNSSQGRPLGTGNSRTKQVEALSFQSQGLKPNQSQQLPTLRQADSAMLNASEISLGQRLQETSNIVASRYGKTISQKDVELLRQTYYCGDNMLNFLIRYLEERQSSKPPTTLRQMKIRTLFLTTTFFKALQGENKDPDKIDYAGASFYTRNYMGKGKTIFDLFDLILIPVIVSPRETTLVCVNLVTKVITYFDSMLNGDGARSMAASQLAQTGLLTNPNLLCCLRFLEMEHNEKLMKPLNLLQWQLLYSPHERVVDYRQANLLVALVLHQVSSGQRVDTSLEKLSRFSMQLQQLFPQIGITKNKKNEIHFEQMAIEC